MNTPTITEPKFKVGMTVRPSGYAIKPKRWLNLYRQASPLPLLRAAWLEQSARR